MRHFTFLLSFFLPFALTVLHCSILQAQNKVQIPRPGESCFIQNNGQLRDQNGKAAPSVKFLLSSPNGLNIQLRANGFSYDTYSSADSAKPLRSSHLDRHSAKASRRNPVKINFHRIDVEFVGASASPQALAEKPVSFPFNYSTGMADGPRNIRAAAYQKIIYKSIYPSIDLVFTATDGKPEYNFIVHPGGDPNVIRWKYHGAIKTHIGGNSIVISLSKGELREHIPNSYQPAERRTAPIHVRYRILSPTTYAYAVAPYDHSKDLIIDPTPDLLWGTYYGYIPTEWAYCVARDSLGNVVFGGTTWNTTGIATTGAYQTVVNGPADAMVIKFDASGNLIWGTYFGGESYDNLYGVAVDHENNIYALGSTFSKTGIATPGAYKTTYTAFNGCVNTYVAKFSPTGALSWATYYGGEMDDEAYAITVDHNDDLVFCGGTSSTTGIATPGAWQPTFADGPAASLLLAEDVFLAKFTNTGAIIWSTYYGGVGWDRAYGVAIDPDNNILLTGNTYSNGMSTPGTFQPQPNVVGTESAFVAKFSAAGSRIWSTYFGKGGIAQGGGYGAGVTVDPAGNIYVAGYTSNTQNIATAGSLQPTIGAANSYGDGFLIKFDKNGVSEMWGTYIGGESTDYANAVCTDGSSVYITGLLGSATNAVTPGSYQPNYTGFGEIYVTKFDLTGNRLWGTYYGISPANYYSGEGMAVVADGLGDVYVVGQVSAPQGIASCGAYQSTPGFGVAFIAKFGEDKPASVTISASRTNDICPGMPVLLTAQPLNAPAPTYQWMLDGQPVAGDTSSISLSTLANGDSVRCLLVLNPTCASGIDTSNSIVFHVDPELSPSLSISTPLDSVCPGVAVTFTAAPVNAGSQPSFQWYVNGVAQGSDSTGFTTHTLQTGDVVSCLLTHQGSCITDSTAPSNPIGMSVRQAPAMSVSISSGQNPICAGTSVAFTANANASAAFSYEWLVNGAPAGTDSATFSSTTLQDGDQILCRIQTTASVCTFPSVPSDTLTETVFPTPTVGITGDSILIRGGQTQLKSTVSVNPVTYQWSPDSSLNSGTSPDPIATPWLTTAYNLTVTSTQGCTAQKSFTIQVVPKISIPNAFTPDGNGRNDLFRATYGPDISDVRLFVFDRWGQLLFTDPGAHHAWDGTFNGKKQPTGTYVWMFEYKDKTGSPSMLKGTVELVR